MLRIDITANPVTAGLADSPEAHPNRCYVVGERKAAGAEALE